MNFGFVLIAGALAASAALLLLLPLMRRREDGRQPAAITAIVVVFFTLLGGGGLYWWSSKYPWSEVPVVANTPAAMAAKLAKRLASQPDDLQGWLMLGRSYFELEQYPLAARAYLRADQVAHSRNAEAIIGLAESLLAQDFDEIRGNAGKLFERVLDLEPQNPKGLLYGALAAMTRNELPLARERFNSMLAQNPPENIRAIIEKQLQTIDAMQGQQAGAPADDGSRVQVHVTVSPSLKYQLTAQSMLYVLARDPAQPGPPFAARQMAVKFPADITLTAADAMLPQRRIASGQKLDVVARISLGGQPISASGDPFGQVSYHVGKDGKLNLVIDRLAP